MASLQKKWKGLAFCLLLAVPSWFLGKMFPIIGGAVITQEYADEIGADGYSKDAADAVKLAKSLM